MGRSDRVSLPSSARGAPPEPRRVHRPPGGRARAIARRGGGGPPAQVVVDRTGSCLSGRGPVRLAVLHSWWGAGARWGGARTDDREGKGVARPCRFLHDRASDHADPCTVASPILPQDRGPARGLRAGRDRPSHHRDQGYPPGVGFVKLVCCSVTTTKRSRSREISTPPTFCDLHLRDFAGIRGETAGIRVAVVVAIPRRSTWPSPRIST